MGKIKILIADDHSVVREGIKSMLNDVSDFAFVGEAENGKEAIEKINVLFPDIIIMDISMPVMTGIEAIKIIKKDYSEVKTIVLTIHSEKEYIEQIYKSGATGCLYKNAGKHEFESAIRAIYKGENYFSTDISNALLKEHFSPHDKENSLTQRELQILKLIVEEFSNHEIADNLFISVRTVETHRKNLMQKLNIDSTIGLIKYAVKKGLIADQ
jgi:DNA-binding NarL/FixJ family response regulator